MTPRALSKVLILPALLVTGSAWAAKKKPAKSSSHPQAVSVSFELRQDFLVVPPTDACIAGSAAQRCVLAGTDVPYVDRARSRRVYGVALATPRAVVGVGRMLTRRIGLGASVGAAFRGAPYRSGGASFLPLHAEACASYWPRGVLAVGWSFSAAVCGGVAESDARISLPSTTGDPRSVDLWLTPGYLFGGAKVGAAYGWGPGALSVQIGSAVEFPTVGVVVTPAVAYVRRF